MRHRPCRSWLSPKLGTRPSPKLGMLHARATMRTVTEQRPTLVAWTAVCGSLGVLVQALHSLVG